MTEYRTLYDPLNLDNIFPLEFICIYSNIIISLPISLSFFIYIFTCILPSQPALTPT